MFFLFREKTYFYFILFLSFTAHILQPIATTTKCLVQQKKKKRNMVIIFGWWIAAFNLTVPQPPINDILAILATQATTKTPFYNFCIFIILFLAWKTTTTLHQQIDVHCDVKKPCKSADIYFFKNFIKCTFYSLFSLELCLISEAVCGLLNRPLYWRRTTCRV